MTIQCGDGQSILVSYNVGLNSPQFLCIFLKYALHAEAPCGLIDLLIYACAIYNYSYDIGAQISQLLTHFYQWQTDNLMRHVRDRITIEWQNKNMAIGQTVKINLFFFLNNFKLDLQPYLIMIIVCLLPDQ